MNEKGEFESPIPSDNRRFFTMLGTLVGGRIGILDLHWLQPNLD
jgi:acyl-CoA oxidase